MAIAVYHDSLKLNNSNNVPPPRCVKAKIQYLCFLAILCSISYIPPPGKLHHGARLICLSKRVLPLHPTPPPASLLPQLLAIAGPAPAPPASQPAQRD